MEVTTYSVAELARAVAQAISRAFPDEIWVQGEIRDLSRAPSGHVYFTLVDPDSERGTPEMMPVTLFATDKVAVNRVLQRSGAVRMTDGVAVRIRGRVTHYAPRGTVQVQMSWIDTDYTIGKLAAERSRLIKSLSDRGLMERNRSLAVPIVPLTVGLVTSVGSAAHADFVDELKRSGFAWKVRLFDARVQGVDAVGDVVSGINSLRSHDVDVIAVVRGGGAQTDLAAFDAEEIAMAIVESPVPVLTGIGHEIDTSVADLVARAFKTPTACAAGLVALVSAFVDRLTLLAGSTANSVKSRLDLADHQLDATTLRFSRSARTVGVRGRQKLIDIGGQMGRQSRGRLRRERLGIADLGLRISRVSGRQLVADAADVNRMETALAAAAVNTTATASTRLADLEHRLSLLDPDRLLARGWSITRAADGRLVTHPGEASAGTELRTTVVGGEIQSVVVNDKELSGG